MALKDSKHEKFAQLWHEGLSKSEAYRQSHPNASKWKDETVHKRASELSLKGEVKGRYEELQEESLRSHNITVESLLRELDEVKGIALGADTPQSSAAVTAIMSKAKLVGLDKNIVEQNVKVTSRVTLDDFYS